MKLLLVLIMSLICGICISQIKDNGCDSVYGEHRAKLLKLGYNRNQIATLLKSFLEQTNQCREPDRTDYFWGLVRESLDKSDNHLTQPGKPSEALNFLQYLDSEFKLRVHPQFLQEKSSILTDYALTRPLPTDRDTAWKAALSFNDEALKVAIPSNVHRQLLADRIRILNGSGRYEGAVKLFRQLYKEATDANDVSILEFLKQITLPQAEFDAKFHPQVGAAIRKIDSPSGSSNLIFVILGVSVLIGGLIFSIINRSKSTSTRVL